MKTENRFKRWTLNVLTPFYVVFMFFVECVIALFAPKDRPEDDEDGQR